MEPNTEGDNDRQITSVQRRPRQMQPVAIAFILIVFVGSVVLFSFRDSPKNSLGFEGTLQLIAPPGVTVYAGNQAVKSPNRKLSWNEVFGTVCGARKVQRGAGE